MTDTLGQRIRAARRAYGLTQAELARRIGMSGIGLCQIENDRTTDPAASRIKALATVLGVSADYLLGLDRPGASALQPSTRKRPARVRA